jgi:hypothetical protein
MAMYHFSDEYANAARPHNPGDQYAFESLAIVRANQLYEIARLKHFFTSLWARLRRRPGVLLSLADARPGQKTENVFSLGVQPVPVRLVSGSESRTRDFDANFNPAQHKNRERWLTIARVTLMGGSLPAVELVKAGDIYYVRDGHHRVSVARAVGQSYIDAQVIVLQAEALPTRESAPTPLCSASLRPQET